MTKKQKRIFMRDLKTEMNRSFYANNAERICIERAIAIILKALDYMECEINDKKPST